ncbi:MAG: hypothetical protein QM690_09595 [Sphingobium sp.]
MTDSYDDELGEQIVRALRSAGAVAVRSALIGCHFYHDDPDDVELITDAPSDAAILIAIRNGKTRRLPYGALEQGYIIPNGPELRAALQAARTPREEELDRAAAILASERVNSAALAADDRLALAEAFEDARAGVLPDAAMRQNRYKLLRRYELYRQGVGILEGWRAMLPQDSGDQATILIELAACYRYSGEIRRAFEVTDLLAGRVRTLTPGARAVFASERAAILLDLFERDHDPARLVEARRWAGVAWSIDQSEYVSMIYKRLTSLEGTG